jgi:PIN domain nuclease of toxin-antitoxin system
VSAVLADTHVLIWWLAGSPRLSSSAAKVIVDSRTEVRFSAASVWEISIKHAAGKLDMRENLLHELDYEGFIELPISARHGLIAGALPSHHRDPFDRVLVAQAQSENLTLITNDERIAAYDVPVLW